MTFQEHHHNILYTTPAVSLPGNNGGTTTTTTTTAASTITTTKALVVGSTTLSVLKGYIVDKGSLNCSDHNTTDHYYARPTTMCRTCPPGLHMQLYEGMFVHCLLWTIIVDHYC
jgi:hypothetical protein